MAKKDASLAVPADRTWNICMLAHVDHGKSALSDCLISSNGIISNRSAGKMRYMDSRDDEQLRGITMKSSSIALGYSGDGKPMRIVHLVDSPGHVDFSGEVEAALRVCDGALLVVDVVEGVCVQTVTVLRAALEHAVAPVLVLNKIDRLFTELKLTPIEAYRHIQQVIQSVNVIMGVREVEQMMEEATLHDTSEWTLDDSGGETESGFFSPELGNVAFSSAIDGWAFRISDFATIFSKRFGISEKVLRRTLWGDYYLQMKSKRIVRKRKSDATSKSEPMFSKFIMASIHSIYDTLLSTQNDYDLALEKRNRIVEKLGLKVKAPDLRYRDVEVVTNAIMSAWLPASRSLLEMVFDKLPSAAVAQANPERLAIIWPHVKAQLQHPDGEETADVVHRKEAFKRQNDALSTCASDDSASVLAVVTKMIEYSGDDKGPQYNIRTPKSREEIAAKKAAKAAAEAQDGVVEEEKNKVVGNGKKMIAFARLLSGTVKLGDELYAYGPKYLPDADGLFDEEAVSKVTVTSLHLLMGRNIEELCSVSAGSIVGIGGVEEGVLKTATLSTEKPGECLPAGVTHTGLHRDAVVRVAVEPHLANQLPQLKEGLRKLNQADPSVETSVTSRGEYVVAASGELHLERCLTDLRKNFAKGIKIHVSKPIVSFRETVVGGTSPYLDEDERDKEEEKEKGDENEKKVDEPIGIESPFLDNSTFSFGAFVPSVHADYSFRMFAAPLPTNLSNTLEKAGATVRSYTQRRGNAVDLANVFEEIMEALRKDAKEAESTKLSAAQFEEQWTEVLECVWACGSKGFGPNLLIGPHTSINVPDHLRLIFGREVEMTTPTNGSEETGRRMKALESAIMTGFQLGAQTGPLADEPMHGVAIFVDCINVKLDGSVANVSGSAMGAARECARKAVLRGNARIMEGVLLADVSVTSEHLGAAYTVIGKLRGKVLDEQMKDGVNVFGISALIPVVESYGFADKLRKKTSGFAVPQMLFSHWETIEIDPFWEPRTEEELEELGAADGTAEKNNLACKLMKQVRRKKGLRVDEKIVENAEKQRTLSRKK